MNFENIKLIAIDVDGTLTDGNYYLNKEGDIYKNFFTRDMYAIDKASKYGFKIVFITSSKDEIIYAKVGSKYPVISACENKLLKLNRYIEENSLSWEEVAYIGDAENDYNCMFMAAFSACPSDAVSDIVAESNYHSKLPGGRGAVYDIIRYLYIMRNIHWSLE